MIKKRVTASIAIHHIQADIIIGLQSGAINLQKHSLRDIGEIIKIKGNTSQKVKHHLEQLVKLGVIEIKDAEYRFEKRL